MISYAAVDDNVPLCAHAGERSLPVLLDRPVAANIRRLGLQGSKLFVGNLSYSVTSEMLRELFSKFGEVREANVIEGKGFGFVQMSTPDEAQKAMDALNNTDFEGRGLRIDEAHERKSGGGRGDRDRRGPRRR